MLTETNPSLVIETAEEPFEMEIADISDEIIEKDREAFDRMLTGHLMNESYTRNDIEELEYYKSLHSDNDFQKKAVFYYLCLNMDETVIVEDEIDLVANLCVAIQNFERSTSGDLENASRGLTNDSNIEDIKSSIALKYIINGS